MSQSIDPDHNNRENSYDSTAQHEVQDAQIDRAPEHEGETIGEVSTPSSRVEVRKRIVVEEVTVTLPIRREVVDVIQIMDDGSEHHLRTPESSWEPRVENRMDDSAEEQEAKVAPRDQEIWHHLPGSDAPLHPDEHGGVDVVLYEERPIITTEVYGYERFRLDV